MDAAVRTGIVMLEILFACGIIGSCLVLLLSMIEDFEVWFAHETSEEDRQRVGVHPDFTTT